jgi:hypothetical protein
MTAMQWLNASKFTGKPTGVGGAIAEMKNGRDDFS